MNYIPFDLDLANSGGYLVYQETPTYNEFSSVIGGLPFLVRGPNALKEVQGPFTSAVDGKVILFGDGGCSAGMLMMLSILAASAA